MSTTILHLCNSLNQGGAEQVLTRLVTSRSADPSEHHLVVTLLPGGVFTDGLRAAGVEVLELDFRRRSAIPVQAVKFLRTLRRVRPNVLLTWLYQSCIVGSLSRVAVGRTRLIWNLRGTAEDPTEASFANRASMKVLKRSSSLPWAVAVNSRQGRVDHADLGFRPRRWAYVPNGFDPDEWYPDASDREQVRHEIGLDAKDKVFAMVARTAPQKDHANVLDAFHEIANQRPDARLLLVGTGTQELPLPYESRERVICLGARADVARLVRACDIAVLSSAYGEGLPNAIAEQMLTGLPSVVTDVGDSRVLVGDTGRVVPPRDPAALAAAMLELFDMDQEARQNLGRRARLRVAERYSMEQMQLGFQRLWSDFERA